MTTFNKLFIAFMLVAAAAFGQVNTLSSTTLASAIATNNATTINLTSTSTMLSMGSGNAIQTVLYVDREFMWVNTVVDSTHVTVFRGKGIGVSARPVPHASGAKVYFANTNTTGPATKFFSNGSLNSEESGSCTTANEFVLPKIYLFSGNVYDCKSSGQWILVGNGTAGQSGSEVRAFCTGTVGSAETEFLNGAACSGATTSTATYMISSPGTLANLYISSSANFLGTGGSVFFVRKNGTNTTLTCIPTAATKTCSDTTHSVAVLPGDLITVSFLSSTSDTAANLSIVVGHY